MKHNVRIQGILIGDGNPLVLIAGPCVVEEGPILQDVARELASLRRIFNLPVIFKSSYRKANRTSDISFTGIGMQEAMERLREIRTEYGFPLLTDVHTESECATAAETADILQIPAFLCRQTDLLRAAGRTKKPVNIKKGQFMAPNQMRYQAEKVMNAGGTGVLLTERGTTFGYGDLVVDMRSIPIMKAAGYPVVFDATHSVQVPGGATNSTGGRPEFIAPLAAAAVAAGCNALFVETHPEPAKAMSDAGSQLALELLGPVVERILRIHAAVSGPAGGTP
jgi:2-dehydro-3-deoxyphosphooctonate aldolase (KDO 8-P synthase)